MEKKKLLGLIREIRELTDIPMDAEKREAFCRENRRRKELVDIEILMRIRVAIEGFLEVEDIRR